MKKDTLFLFVLLFSFGLFNINVNNASAANCAPGDLFSTITGQACDATTVPTECKFGDLFSSLTGKSCSGMPPIIYCTAQTDFQINYKGDDVKTLQIQLNAQGANLNVDGSYGPLTQAARLKYCPSMVLTVTKSSSYGDQTIVAGTNNVRLGSFVLAAGPTEDVSVSMINFSISNMMQITNLRLMSNGVQIGNTIPVPWSSSTYPVAFSVSAMSSKTIDIYGDVMTGTVGTIQATVSASGVSLASGTSVTTTSTPLQTITISSSTPSITILSPNGTTSLPNGTVGTSYSASIAGSGGGNDSYQWSATGLPAGLSVANISCPVGTNCQQTFHAPTQISGTPTTTGTYTVTVTLTSGTQTVSKQFSLVVSAVNTPSITVLFPNGGENLTVGAQDPDFKVTWTSSNLLANDPVQVRLVDSSGGIAVIGSAMVGQGSVAISLPIPYGQGAPATYPPTGRYKIELSTDCTNSSAATQDRSDNYFTITAATTAPVITTTSLSSGIVGSTYSANIAGSGGSNSYQWSVTGLPAGLQTIQANVTCAVGLPCLNQVPILITGTPTTAGTYTVNVTLTSGTLSVSKQFNLVVVTTVPLSSNEYEYIWNNVWNLSDQSDPEGITIDFTIKRLMCDKDDTVQDCWVSGGKIITEDVGAYGYDYLWNSTKTILWAMKYTRGNRVAVLGAESFKFTQFLKEGSRGNEVVELQKFLNNASYDVGIADGKFGAKTKEAVIKFQIANNLKSDGIVGSEVRMLLNK